MRNGTGMELAIGQKNVDAMRGSIVAAIRREGITTDILKGMVMSLLDQMTVEELGRWYEYNTADNPPDISVRVDEWMIAWMQVTRET